MKILLSILVALCFQVSASQPHADSFGSFAMKFFSDSNYQVQAIRFPIQKVTRSLSTMKNDTTWITRTTWAFSDFGYFRNQYNVQLYDNFNKELRDSGERVIALEGVENGVNVALYFKKSNSRWWLVKIVDKST